MSEFRWWGALRYDCFERRGVFQYIRGETLYFPNDLCEDNRFEALERRLLERVRVRGVSGQHLGLMVWEFDGTLPHDLWHIKIGRSVVGRKRGRPEAMIFRPIGEMVVTIALLDERRLD